MIRDGKGGQGKGGKGKVSEDDRKGGMKEKEGKGREREGIRGRKRSEVETDRKGAHPVEKEERGGKQTGGKYLRGAQKRNLLQISAWSVKMSSFGGKSTKCRCRDENLSGRRVGLCPELDTTPGGAVICRPSMLARVSRPLPAY